MVITKRKDVTKQALKKTPSSGKSLISTHSIWGGGGRRGGGERRWSGSARLFEFEWEWEGGGVWWALINFFCL